MTVGGALLILIGVLGFAFAAMVLRADPKRWDNRVFAVLVFIDATMAVTRGGAILSGAAIMDRRLTDPMAGISFLLVLLTVEFAWSYPFSRRAPWPLRIATILVTGAAALLYFLPSTRPDFQPVITYLYFTPNFILILSLLIRNFRRLDRGERMPIALVMIAVAFRWLWALVCYGIGFPLGLEVFTTLLWIEATAAAMIAFTLIGFAVLRSQLFSLRGVAAEILVYSGFGVTLVGFTALAVDAVMRWVPDGTPQRVLLVATAIVRGWSMVGKRVEDALCNVDPRRALRREVLERAIRPEMAGADPDTLLGEIKKALSDLTQGGEVHWIPASEVPAPLLEHIREDATPSYLTRGQTSGAPMKVRLAIVDVPGDLLVQVSTRTKVYGLLALTGRIDRETLLAAQSLGEHLALKMENHALVGDLEEARRLATLGSFAAAIAHDLRTPLTSITMNVQILRGKAKLPPDDMEYFDIALDELQRLSRHLTELLDYAKPVQLHEAPVELREVVDDAAKGIEPVLRERKLALTCEHAADVPPVVVDTQRMRQVLWNLLDNAVKASPDGGAITLRTRRVEPERVAIDVSDEGSGIAERDLPRIFEPFFTTRPDGTGLGLAICQKLVRAHAGEIHVRSSTGRGATFTIVLPSTPGSGARQAAH
jgi:signal transduction histidine kinase